MIGLFSASKQLGWLVVELDERTARYVHGRAHPSGKSAITLFGSRALAAPADAEKLAKELRCAGYSCATLLKPGDYQMLMVEAPNVPPEELKAAVRWRLKDLLDYPVDNATIDVLDIPPPSEGVAERSHQIFAVAARNDLIQGRIKRFDDARIPLTVIDIPETAQRNIGALYEQADRGLALLYAGDESCLLTVNFRAELILCRRIDIGLRQFRADALREEAFNRVVLELQRTFDLIDRQFQYAPVAKLLLAPTPEDTGLAGYLRENIGIAVETIDLAASLAFNGKGAPDAATQWRLFHLFGAALRHAAKAL